MVLKFTVLVACFLLLSGSGCVNNFVPSQQQPAQQSNSQPAPATIAAPAGQSNLPNNQPTASGGGRVSGEESAAKVGGQTRGTIDNQEALIELTELSRISGDMVMARFSVTNNGTDTINGGFFHQAVVATYLIDSEQQKKYQIVRDANNKPLATAMSFEPFAPKSKREVFAQFPAPPLDTKRMSVYFGGKMPIMDVPLTQ